MAGKRWVYLRVYLYIEDMQCYTFVKGFGWTAQLQFKSHTMAKWLKVVCEGCSYICSWVREVSTAGETTESTEQNNRLFTTHNMDEKLGVACFFRYVNHFVLNNIGQEDLLLKLLILFCVPHCMPNVSFMSLSFPEVCDNFSVYSWYRYITVSRSIVYTESSMEAVCFSHLIVHR